MSGQSVSDGVTIPALPTPVAASPIINPTTGNVRLFTEDEIEAARRQEKEKLYPRLTKMEEQLSVFQAEREEAQRQVALAQEQADADRKARELEELGLKDLVVKTEDKWKEAFNTAQAEWEQKFGQLQQESEARQQLLEKEREFQALQTFRNRRIQEEADSLHPDLIDYVTGNTEEEIESSISAAVAKSAAIVASIQQVVAASQPQRLRGIPATGSTSTGPLDNTLEQQTLTTADIAAMTMSEYAQYRDRLLPAASRSRGR